MKSEKEPVVSSVLVALDKSDKSWKALLLGINFVRKHEGSKLHIIHAVPKLLLPVTGDMAPSAYIIIEKEEDMIISGKELVSRAIAAAKEKGVEDVEGKVEVGNPVDIILSRARAVSADMIVLGNRGMGFRKGVLLGSVSERIVAGSESTVIVVK